MKEEKKLDEKKSMEGRGSFEDEEDHKATLYYDLEKEIRLIFEQFTQKKQSMRTIGHFARGLLALEIKYQKEGLGWEDIDEIRKGVLNGRRTKANIN